MKMKLREEDPESFIKFEHVWKVRNSHMVPNLPSQYLFYLICCFKEGCSHPVCCSSMASDIPSWYPGGPSLFCLPIPTPDPCKSWGNKNCLNCREFCAGHYKEDSLIDVRTLKCEIAPPSAILKKLFAEKGEQCFYDAQLEQAAELTLLPKFEVNIWLNHLKTVLKNRKRGSEKAAATRARKRTDSDLIKSHTSKQPPHFQAVPSQTDISVEEQECFCGQCGELYVDGTAEVEMWVACDMCDVWYHCKCEQLLSPPSSTELYICKKCQT